MKKGEKSEWDYTQQSFSFLLSVQDNSAVLVDRRVISYQDLEWFQRDMELL